MFTNLYCIWPIILHKSCEFWFLTKIHVLVISGPWYYTVCKSVNKGGFGPILMISQNSQSSHNADFSRSQKTRYVRNYCRCRCADTFTLMKIHVAPSMCKLKIFDKSLLLANYFGRYTKWEHSYWGYSLLRQWKIQLSVYISVPATK